MSSTYTGPVCGRCHGMPVKPNQAWCEYCQEESSHQQYVLGVHVSQMDPADVRFTGCTCPSGTEHANNCPTML